ncbi:MAG: hypothetical protein EXS32_01055 [Opitutus sp.]|nr:hypothetical protein [Opitutus sp.]
MIHFLVAFGLLAHVLFWGAGLAWLAMPRPWRRFWPVLMMPAGLALQSAVVWFGALANFPGTNSYARWSEAIPLALLVVALWWRSRRSRAGLLGEIRAGWVDVQRIGMVWLAIAGGLALLVAPLAWAAKGLTTISLGSCDAADYAAGARVLMEFARTERGGFLGLTEVVSVQSVDNFFDYWTRINHFTPSALIAFNGSVLDCAPHELTSLLTMVLLAGSLPVVFWMARAVVGFSGAPSVAVAVLFALSPLNWYVVGHVAPGQLLAAMAVALITWAGVALWRGRLTWARGGQFAGVLAVGYWLVLGSYNFFVVLCLVPAAAHAGGLALWTSEWRRLGRWLLVMLAPLALCGVVFAGRVAGLIERFQLLRQYDFGWKIPVLTPEGWLGLVSGPALEPWRVGGLRWLLAAGVVTLLAWATARAVGERRQKTWVAMAVTLPVLVGYELLQGRGARLGTNASYDAFKLFMVFYPVMLPAFCWWITLRWSRRLTEWLGVVGVAGVVLLGNAVGTGMIFWRMATPPLMVDGELRQLRKIEAMPDVASVNVLLPDMWSRLWANAFLLKKPQYFLTHTYEGRRNTPLRGEWDLESSLVAVKPADGARRQITPHYALVNNRSPLFLRATLGDGWHPEESTPQTGERWRWTKGDATLRIENPQDQTLAVTCTLDGWSLGECDLLLVDAAGESTAPQHLGPQRAKTRFATIAVPPGGTTVRLHSAQPAMIPPGDTRTLGVCAFEIQLEVHAN